MAMLGVDETASRRGHRYVTAFVDMQRKQEPVVCAVPGHDDFQRLAAGQENSISACHQGISFGQKRTFDFFYPMRNNCFY